MRHIHLITVFFCAAVFMAGGVQVSAQETMETRVYDISFLDRQEQVYEAGLIGLNPGDAAGMVDSSFDSSIDPEFLINMLRSAVKEDVDFNSMTSTELEITASQSAHKVIANAIAGFKSISSKRIEVSAWLICVDSGVLDAVKAENAKLNTMAVNDKQFGMLKSAGKWAEEFELVLNDCQKGTTYSSRQISFTGDYDAELSQGVSAYSPFVEKYYEGVRLHAVPCIAYSGNMIRLDIGLSHSNLAGEIEKFKTGYCGDIELPEEDELEIATSVVMQDGTTVIAGTIESSVHAGREVVILLVHCRITGDSSKSRGIMSIADPDGSTLSVYNIRALSMPVTTVYSFPFGYTELNDKAAYPAPPLAELANMDIFSEKVRFAVGVGDDDAGSFNFWQNFAVFRADKSLTARIDSFMKEQETIGGRLVSVEAVYCKLPQQLYNDAIVPVERAKRAGLILDAVAKNPELKLASCSIQGFNKHIFGIHRLDKKRIVSDNEVLIGPGIFAYDPVIETISQGAALQVLPVIIEDGKKTALDLNAAFRKFDKPMRVFEVDESGSRYYQPAVSEYKLSSRIVLESNVWDYVILPSVSIKEKEYIFILLKAAVK